MSNKHTMSRCAGIAFALLVLAGASVRADMLQWSYNWEPSSARISANSASGGSNGYLSLTNEPVNSVTGSSNTVITNFQAFSNATMASPDTFTNVPFSFTLHLEDLASKAAGVLTFSGVFNGFLTADNANIQATFTSAASQSLTLGGNTYTVTLGTYSPPGPPDTKYVGSMNAIVSVAAGDTGGGHTASTPEPSTLLLASLAFPYFGLTGWRKRRKQRRTQ